MAQIFEARSPSTPDVQDTFLNLARRNRAIVQVVLMDGSEVEARIKSYDRFAVIIEQDGVESMVFKHAIAQIRTPSSASGAESDQQS